MSPNKLTFLVDNIDPITGPKPNLLGFTDEKYTLKSIFTNCRIEYRSSWSAPDIDKWFYPIMLMDGITLNNFLLQKDIFIKNHISERVQLGLKNKKGKILIVVYEPVSQLTSHILSENFGDNLNFVFVTLHNIDKSNFLTYVPCSFIGCGTDGRGLKKEKEESNTINIDKLDNRYFSCFTYFYNDNPYTTLAISLLEKNNLLDKGFVSMYNKGIDFEKLISLSKLHYQYDWLLAYDFTNSDKVFDLLPVEQCLKQSLFNFVVESFDGGTEVYVSEKTHRNFLYKKAFLSWGSPNQLKLIKSQGYKTFSPIINESYDAVENHKKRFTMVIDELKRLVNKDYNELKNDFITINHILDHNYSNFLKRNDNIGNKLIGTFNE